ncbi:helix-turn-helix transcriptional regulator [Legionella pneumophila]|uniref:helix-turn-helix domain-containing protein n=1 Tax=Legionella pneumophila TaxID=446 RepID=UPI001E2FF715|nr:helix-turn-helix transcriptional regulator [Legionella pneumophila]MDI9827308.1 helix-turn-helix transcriptional regulator [Legionella pneumophila]MDW8902048.1 helix-turn-helix transcriptional regulator [Legionella pneumophila]MDW8907352.1 helix-turn-helix transcriptional regulator [Legionella pneumophila]MDW9050984.1 helix-turn-helix transcriptional regulator [Legionella pneumophila]MDW9060066.1 helix-turn-helix transcriptional regulator [Legionella pneumophila]
MTIKVLAEMTGLGAARIGNWEQGTRSPGPEEAMVLSKELRVAASWLLCLTDDPYGERLDYVAKDLLV